MHNYSYTVLVVNKHIYFAKLLNCKLVTKILVNISFFFFLSIIFITKKHVYLWITGNFWNNFFHELHILLLECVLVMILCYFIAREKLVEKRGEH